MRFWIRLAILVAALSGAMPVWAAESLGHSSVPVARARLITAQQGIAPGAATVSAGIHIELNQGWKTYWRSPGEVGLPPEITWEGSENLASVDMLWPAPTRFTAFDIENFGYADQVVFPLQVALENPGAPAHLRANVQILICKETCIPDSFELDVELPPGDGIDGPSAALIAEFAQQTPLETGTGVTATGAHINSETLTVAFNSDTPFGEVDVFPEYGEGSAFGAPEIWQADAGKTIWAAFDVLALDDTPPPLKITLVDQNRAVTLPVVLGETPPAAPVVDRAPRSFAQLGWTVLLALLGGLILNVMPCVLPVLSIKLTSALKAQDQSLARIRQGFLASVLGVMAFMWTLAAAMIVARAMGNSVGWGLQFQSPLFLAVMTTVLVFFAANMFGLFELQLPQSWNTKMSNTSGHGLWGDFGTGALAAVLATPCSAPFLGTAVAFALSGNTIDVMVIFTALGLGLAAPYLLVALFPQMIHRLPKPGRWMIWVKVGMGVLLAATAVWLFSVLAGVAGPLAALLIAAVLILALGVLRFGTVLATGLRRSMVGLLLVFAVALPAVLPEPAAKTQQADAIAWQGFTTAAIAKSVDAGQVVFVDITADWCLTCQANKRLVLAQDQIAEVLNSDDITALQGDWTRPDASISRYLNSNGRFGIPFNAVYGPGARDGILLPEVLTPGLVLNAIKEAR